MQGCRNFRTYLLRNKEFWLRKKLIGGIVVTGGGSQLKHMNQLIEFTTGMDSRVGYPNEHLSSVLTLV